MSRPAPLEERLATIPPRKFGKVDGLPDDGSAWPPLAGSITIAFTSRVGSTFLCREIEKTFCAATIGETFRLDSLSALLQRQGLSGPRSALMHQIRASAEAGWFVVKTGLQALLLAEKTGFYEHYRDRSVFVFLLRRDLLGQAISLASAKMTGQFHSTQEVSRAVGADDFDDRLAGNSVRNIVQGCSALQDYLEASKWPVQWLLYEDFADGEFSGIFAALDAIGLPRRDTPMPAERTSVERVGRDFADEWRKRMRAMPSVRRYTDEYERLLDRVGRTFPHMGLSLPARSGKAAAGKKLTTSEIRMADANTDKQQKLRSDRAARDTARAARDQVREKRDRLKEITAQRATLLEESRSIREELKSAKPAKSGPAKGSKA